VENTTVESVCGHDFRPIWTTLCYTNGPDRRSTDRGARRLEIPSARTAGHRSVRFSDRRVEACRRRRRQASRRYANFFGSIENDNTRAAYGGACANFFAWCEARGIIDPLGASNHPSAGMCEVSREAVMRAMFKGPSSANPLIQPLRCDGGSLVLRSIKGHLPLPRVLKSRIRRRSP
jgi:hypothetical protein